MPDKRLSIFYDDLLKWHYAHPRPMPWKDTADPYHIWISEVILQQTRVNQGLEYYLNFIRQFPDIQTLASATIDEVLKAWEGLGYYTRARNLHKAAQLIVHEMSGEFPHTYEQLLKLPGTGSYTAAAVASFAYELPHAVVDGNVIRVLSRFFGISGDENEQKLKKEISATAESLVTLGVSSVFNQAIMNFGALQCSPGFPDCNSCMLRADCFAFQHDKVRELPPRKKFIKKKKRYFTYFLLKYKNGCYIEQRTENDIWKNLYQLPCTETDETWSLHALPGYLQNRINEAQLLPKIHKHILTHQTIFAKVYLLNLSRPVSGIPSTIQYAEPNILRNFAFPKLVLNILQQQAFL